MSLITDLSPKELADLQAEMLDPANVKRLAGTLPDAVKPATVLHPLQGNQDTELFGMGWSSVGVSPPGTRIVPVVNPNPKGFQLVKVYHSDPDRYEKAKASQPEPGEKPIELSDDNMILRMGDGTLVHKFPDSPIPGEG